MLDDILIFFIHNMIIMLNGLDVKNKGGGQYDCMRIYK